jgi:hypothetical protein
MRGFLFLLTMAAAARAQPVPAPPGAPQGIVVSSGVPLRVALERRVIVKRVGEPIQGRLVEPIYVFDRMILPAGSLVEGHVSEIGGVPFGRRLQALLYGNLTPPRDIHAQFDTLVLNDGSRISLHTAPARGTPHTARVAKPGKKSEERFSPLESTRDRIQSDRAAFLAFKEPGKWSRLKDRLFEMPGGPARSSPAYCRSPSAAWRRRPLNRASKTPRPRRRRRRKCAPGCWRPSVPEPLREARRSKPW